MKCPKCSKELTRGLVSITIVPLDAKSQEDCFTGSLEEDICKECKVLNLGKTFLSFDEN